jgi:hypothetical protein
MSGSKKPRNFFRGFFVATSLRHIGGRSPQTPCLDISEFLPGFFVLSPE